MPYQSKEYFNLINKHQYDYFFSISFHDTYDLNEDKQIKSFLKSIHKKLFSKRYLKYNKLLDIVLIQETALDSNGHYHGLIKTDPHNFTYQRLAQAFQYASKNTGSTRTILGKDIPRFTYNHFKTKYSSILKVSLLRKLNIIDDSNPVKFPLNLIEIESPEDQHHIVKYILKKSHYNNYPIAFLKPERTEYYNFTTYQ